MGFLSHYTREAGKARKEKSDVLDHLREMKTAVINEVASMQNIVNKLNEIQHWIGVLEGIVNQNMVESGHFPQKKDQNDFEARLRFIKNKATEVEALLRKAYGAEHRLVKSVE